jgi:putative transposase
MIALIKIAVQLLVDVLRFVILLFRTPTRSGGKPAPAAATSPFAERGVRPRRVDAATRVSLAILARMFDGRNGLIVVKPATLIRWHRAGWRLFWRFKSRPGRPRIPAELRALIRRMAIENAFWAERRIADELLVKLGIRISPRTVRKYMPKRPAGQPRGDQRSVTFLKIMRRQLLLVSCL